MAVFYPKFLSKNLISSAGTIAISGVSVGNTNEFIKLYDRNSDIVAKTSGYTTGARSFTWTPQASQTITRIAIQNTNISTFTITYNGGSSFSPAISVTTSDHTNFYFEVSSQAITSLEINVTLVQDEPMEAKIGELYIGTEHFEMATTTGAKVTLAPWVYQKINSLSDGTKTKNFVRDGLDYSIDFGLIPYGDIDNYRDLWSTNKSESFVFIPRAATLTDEWDGIGGHVNWVNSFDLVNFARDVAENGYQGTMELGQAGGL